VVKIFNTSEALKNNFHFSVLTESLDIVFQLEYYPLTAGQW
jgi:hypothetical protein